MRWTLPLVLAAGCGSVEPIGPPESSGEFFATSSGAPESSSTTASQTGSSTDTSGGTATSTTTGTSTGQADGSGSTTDDCPLGELGCACLPGTECGEGLRCASEICVPDLACPVEQAGMETCQCTEGGGCDEGLTCASNLCVDASSAQD